MQATTKIFNIAYLRYVCSLYASAFISEFLCFMITCLVRNEMLEMLLENCYLKLSLQRFILSPTYSLHLRGELGK